MRRISAHSTSLKGNIAFLKLYSANEMPAHGLAQFLIVLIIFCSLLNHPVAIRWYKKIFDMQKF